MDRIFTHTVASASDVVAFVACPHVATLDLAVVNGELPAPNRNDSMMEMLQGRGLVHERQHLENYLASGVTVAEIPDGAPRSTERVDDHIREARLHERVDATVAAMRAGAEVVFQATFLDRSGEIWWRSHADFLRRVPHSTALGEWGYEPEDTKLSTHATAWAAMQLCFYADAVSAAQDAQVERIHIALGNGTGVTLRVEEFAAYFRMVRESFSRAVAEDGPTYPLPTQHCRVCRWVEHCEQVWEADDHLVRVANLTVQHTQKLAVVGVATFRELAVSPADLIVPGIGEETVRRLQQQARLQHRAVPGQPPPWEFVQPFEESMGLASLPAPNRGDVFYDIEGHPYAIPGGLEYLHGLEWFDGSAHTFHGWWAFDEHQERALYERLIDFFIARRAKHPKMRIYHYASYEVTALTRLMSKYGTREAEMDSLLRGEVFVDLYRVVRQGVRVGTRSYSIKRLEPLYMEGRDADIEDGGSSVVAFERWLQTGEQKILDDILDYNRDDVISNRLLRGWLEERRHEAVHLGLPSRRPQVAEDIDRPLDPDLAKLIAQLNVGRHHRGQP